MMHMSPTEQLRAHPHGFAFFQAVRLLERARDGRAPVGGFADPANEVARFAVPPSLAFPASEIEELQGTGEAQVRMWVNFLGLTGPVGVLPYHYTQLVAERNGKKDPVMQDFYDMFHHRMISLFYRAWEKHRFLVAYERDHADRLGEHVGDLMGLAPADAKKERRVPREALLYYAGLLASTQRTPLALQAMLEDFFGVPVDVQQFVGSWYTLDDDVLARLDDDEDLGTAVLGGGCPVGDEVWDQQTRVRLRIGPLTRATYEQFLPHGSAHGALVELTQAFGGDGIDFEVQLVLARDEVPATVLGADAWKSLPLSWGTWLRTVAPLRDPDDAILTLLPESAR